MAKKGINPENVPAGPDVLQLVTYFTDTEDTPGGGPTHWIWVASPTEIYEPENDVSETTDYGIVDLEAGIQSASKKNKTMLENIRAMQLELQVSKGKKEEEERKEKKQALEREKEMNEMPQKDGSILAVIKPITNLAILPNEDKAPTNTDETMTPIGDKQEETIDDVVIKNPPVVTQAGEEEEESEWATKSEQSMQASKLSPDTQSNKKLKSIQKAPPAKGRTNKRLREQIDRFQPNSFPRPKRRPTKRVKEIYYMPNSFTLAVGKHFCGEDSKQAANCLNSKVSDMGDRPLELLWYPELNENKWTTGLGYGPDQKDRKSALKYCMHSMNIPS